jgi:hypothetical protein
MKNKILMIGVFLLVLTMSFVTSEVYGTSTLTCPTCEVCSVPIVIDETTCVGFIEDSNSSQGWYKILFLIGGIILGFIIPKKIKRKHKEKDLNNKFEKIGLRESKELKELKNPKEQDEELKQMGRKEGRILGGLKVQKEGVKILGNENELKDPKEQDEELNDLIDDLGLGEDIKDKLNYLDEKQNGKKR